MTGVEELRHLDDVQVVPAAPESIRVAVLGGRTQLDIALPTDVRVAAFLPELARLIESRDTGSDEDITDRDERRTFWVLSRIDGETLGPDQTLRGAGVDNGEILRISAQRALSPPTLYDDVVDAAARLNRASYAAWNSTAAGVMAFIGLWLCTFAWVYLLVADELSPHRAVVIGGAAVTTAVLVGGAAVVHRFLDLPHIAAAIGWPAVAISAALGWVLAEGHGAYWLAAACAVLLALTAAHYHVIGTGHWGYIAAAVVFVFGALALLGNAVGARTDGLAAVAAVAAALGCLAVPVLTARLGRSPERTLHDEAGEHSAAAAVHDDSGASMPSAEEVWARVRSVALTRAGLLAGLSAVVVIGATVLMHTVTGWPAFVFALVCAAVLATRGRRAHTVPERAVLVVPATALVLIACAQAQYGGVALRLGGVGVLGAVAVTATLAGLMVAGGGLPRWMPTVAVYLDYAAVASLIPAALWTLGIYDRLGLW